MVKKTVRFGEQAAVPAIGLGTWYMGEHAAQRQQEVAALRAGIDHGLTVIDTAEMYADGGAEEVVGQGDPRSARPGSAGLQSLSLACRQSGDAPRL